NNSHVEIVHVAADRCAVRGALTFATARRADEAGRRCFGSSQSASIEVDCSGITSSDSAGLAVLIDWLAFAKRRGKHLHYVAVPEQIRALARISEVEELLERGA